MSLIIKYKGISSSLYTLGEGGFTKVNKAEVAGTNAPYGVLGGSVAALGENSYEAVPADGTKTSIGLFLNNAEGAPFENSPAVASGKVAVVRGNATVEVDVYEQVTFAIGDSLYASADGFLTNVASSNNQVIGYVTKLPTASDPFLGLELVL